MLALDQDSKDTASKMRKIYNIVLTELRAQTGQEHGGEGWLEQLRQNAVFIAKHEKDMQARRLQIAGRHPVHGCSSVLGSTTLVRGAASGVKADAETGDGKLAMDARVRCGLVD